MPQDYVAAPFENKQPDQESEEDSEAMETGEGKNARVVRDPDGRKSMDDVELLRSNMDDNDLSYLPNSSLGRAATSGTKGEDTFKDSIESNDVSEFELDLDQIEAKLFDDMDKAHEGINNPNAAGAPISPDLKAATFAEV